MSKIYITTPLYYVNDEPHIGHAYTTILADVISRYNKLIGNDVHFLTGTDEHGQKVQEAAKKMGLEPKIHADKYVLRFLDLWKTLNIEYDDFIRTTELRHTTKVQKMLDSLKNQGDIYPDEYEGLYSVSEERFITEREYKTGKFRQVKKIKEKNYFFKMSKYQDQLLSHINNNPNFIQPNSRRNEVLGFLKQPLNDLCISRPKSRLSWGIELPFDNLYVTYVWFDALLNYITAINWGDEDNNTFEKWWPANYHLIGKDIIITHAVYWSTMLMAANIQLPKTIFAHGWWLLDETKMSKSLGNVVKPLDLVGIYGEDALRYYLMRDMVLGQDANFSLSSFTKCYNSELANDLGNLVNRIFVLIEKYFDSKIPMPGKYSDTDLELIEKIKNIPTEVNLLYDTMKVNEALEKISSIIKSLNKFLEIKAPWKSIKEDSNQGSEAATTLYICIDILRISVQLLHPVMPSKTKLILNSMGIKDASNNSLSLSFGKIQNNIKLNNNVGVLFPKIEQEEL